MISDEYLTDVFCRELEETHKLSAAVRAVRLAVEVQRLSRLGQRKRDLGEAGRRGPAPVAPLTEGEVETVIALVASELSLSVPEVKQGVTRRCLRARWVVAGVLRYFGMSYPVIARALAMSDHTRALDGLRRLAGFPNLCALRDAVVARLEGQGWGAARASGREAA